MNRMRGAVAMEWTKAWSVRGTWWGLVAALGLMALISLQMAIYTANSNTNDDPADDRGVVGVGLPALEGLDYAQFAVIGLVMVLITAEYSSGAIRTALQWVPARGVLLGAKAVVGAVVAALAGLLIALVGTVVGAVMLGDSGRFRAGEMLGDLAVMTAYTVLVALLALGLGAVLRGAVLTLSTLFLLLVMVPGGLAASGVGALEEAAEFVPGAGFLDDPGSPAKGLLVVAVWAVCALLLGYRILDQRDA